MDKKDEAQNTNQLEKWLLDITEESDLGIAKGKVQNALNAVKVLPKIGIISLLVGPGGLYNLLIQNSLLDDEDSIADVETAILDLQRQLIQVRRQRGVKADGK